ncbi:MAG: uracil-DNA glycosylase [Muribaculaceae bacterium]|nr:uracil-DNA glycosylase [Muribaculaceae bacterium]
MKVRIHPSWEKALQAQWDAPYFAELAAFVSERYAATTVFPPASRIFAAFDACPFDKVKVVIIGQDPYHDVGQANGLCFSVAENTPLPPSLINIFREIESDLGTPVPSSGDLSRWAQQGVLLLNSTLTVEAHRPGSHQGHGWEELTDAAIDALNRDRSGLVFMLWGSYAKRKGAFIDTSRHLVLAAPHPSPLSAYRGFFGCRHFSQANNYLRQQNITPIEW